MLTLKQEIPAKIRVRAQLDEAGDLGLMVQVSAPYGTPVNPKTGTHECSVDFGRKIPGELRTALKHALEAIRGYTEAHCAQDLQRAIIISHDAGVRLGEIKEG